MERIEVEVGMDGDKTSDDGVELKLEGWMANEITFIHF